MANAWADADQEGVRTIRLFMLIMAAIAAWAAWVVYNICKAGAVIDKDHG